MSKLTALVEAAEKATPWENKSSVKNETHMLGDGSEVVLAVMNPTTILELCALLEKAEEALDGCLARLYGELYPNHPETLEVEEALSAIKQWKEVK